MAIDGPGYVGDFNPGDTVHLTFTTRLVDVPTALTTGTVAVYKNAGTALSIAGITLTANYVSTVGLNHIAITTGSDATFYAAGNDYVIMLGTGSTLTATVVAGSVTGSFSLLNRSANLTKIAGVALSTSTAQLGVNVVSAPPVVQTGVSGNP